MNIYVSGIAESYKDTIIGHLVNAGTEDLLLHIVQCWISYAVDEDNWSLPMAIYCSGVMYKYYSHLFLLPIKHNEEVKNIRN